MQFQFKLIAEGIYKRKGNIDHEDIGEIPDTTMASFGPQVSKKTIANREQTSSNFPRSWAQ